MTTACVWVRFQCCRHPAMSYSGGSVSRMLVCPHRSDRRYHGSARDVPGDGSGRALLPENREVTSETPSSVVATADLRRNSRRELVMRCAWRLGPLVRQLSLPSQP